MVNCKKLISYIKSSDYFVMFCVARNRQVLIVTLNQLEECVKGDITVCSNTIID